VSTGKSNQIGLLSYLLVLTASAAAGLKTALGFSTDHGAGTVILFRVPSLYKSRRSGAPTSPDFAALYPWLIYDWRIARRSSRICSLRMDAGRNCRLPSLKPTWSVFWRGRTHLAVHFAFAALGLGFSLFWRPICTWDLFRLLAIFRAFELTRLISCSQSRPNRFWLL
jgi:hypothetical protein